MKKIICLILCLCQLSMNVNAAGLNPKVTPSDEIARLIQAANGDTPILEIVKRFKQKRTQLAIPWSKDYQTNLENLYQFGVISKEELREARALEHSFDRLQLKSSTSASAAYYQVIGNQQYASIEILIPAVGFVLLALVAYYASKKLEETTLYVCEDEFTDDTRWCIED